MGNDNLNETHEIDKAGDELEINFPTNEFDEIFEKVTKAREDFIKKTGTIL